MALLMTSDERRISHNKSCLKYIQKIKNEVYFAYGNKCQCCGEDKLEFLTVDHIKNNGYSDRNKKMYNIIKKEGFPNTYRLLCYNCNCGRARSDDKLCPHEKHTVIDSWEWEL